MPLMRIPRCERLVRVGGRSRRGQERPAPYEEFVDRKVADILTVAQETASANGRDVILPIDLRLGGGPRDRVREFGRFEGAGEPLATLRQRS